MAPNAEQKAQVESSIAAVSTAQKAALMELEGRWWKTDFVERSIVDIKNYGTMRDRWAELGRDAAEAGKAPLDGWKAWTATGNKMLEGISATMEQSGYTPLSAVKETVEAPVKAAAKVAKKVAKAAPKIVEEAADTYKKTVLGVGAIMLGAAALYGMYLFRGRR